MEPLPGYPQLTQTDVFILNAELTDLQIKQADTFTQEREKRIAEIKELLGEDE